MIEKVIDIAVGAGRILMKYHKGDFKVDFKDKEKKDPVTAADLESQEYILERLKKEFPGEQVLAEESAEGNIDYSKRVWIVDPLDGTQRFINKEDGFGVSIGLCIHGIPFLGVVYAPVREVVYFAEKGKGAFIRKGGKTEKIKVSEVKLVSDSVLVESNSARKLKFLEEASDSLPFKKRVLEGSSVLRICMVAKGEADIFIPPSNKACKWDTCGAQVILEEAGGRISDPYGNPLNYKQDKPFWENSFIVTNGKLHKAVVDKIKEMKK